MNDEYVCVVHGYVEEYERTGTQHEHQQRRHQPRSLHIAIRMAIGNYARQTRDSRIAAGISLQRNDRHSVGGDSQGVGFKKWDLVTAAGRVRETAAADAHRSRTGTR